MSATWEFKRDIYIGSDSQQWPCWLEQCMHWVWYWLIIDSERWNKHCAMECQSGHKCEIWRIWRGACQTWRKMYKKKNVWWDVNKTKLGIIFHKPHRIVNGHANMHNCFWRSATSTWASGFFLKICKYRYMQVFMKVCGYAHCTSVFKGACICAIVFAGMQYAQVSFKVQASVFVGVRLCMIVFESMWAGANILWRYIHVLLRYAEVFIKVCKYVHLQKHLCTPTHFQRTLVHVSSETNGAYPHLQKHFRILA